MLHSEVIGQRPNLTSCSFRAFRFAKRCPGGRGGAVPLLGWFLRRFPPIPRPRGRGRSAARRLAWVVNWAFRRGRRPRRPEPPSIVKRTDSHVQCAHWPRNDRKRLSLRGGPTGRRTYGVATANQILSQNLGRWLRQSASPVPKAPLWKGGRLRAPPVAEEASKKEWQRSKFCGRMRAKNFGHRDRRPNSVLEFD